MFFFLFFSFPSLSSFQPAPFSFILQSFLLLADVCPEDGAGKRSAPAAASRAPSVLTPATSASTTRGTRVIPRMEGRIASACASQAAVWWVVARKTLEGGGRRGGRALSFLFSLEFL